MSNHDNADIVSDTIQALSLVSDHGEQATRLILGSNLTEFLMKLVTSADATLQIPAVRILGNSLSGSDQQTQFLLDRGILPLLLDLTDHIKTGLRKEACWAISNITAGSAAQVQQVISGGLIERLVAICHEDKPEVFSEALWALCNCTENCNPEMFSQLVGKGLIEALFCRFDELPTRNLQVMLIGARNILEAGEKFYKDSNDENLFALEMLKNGYE